MMDIPINAIEEWKLELAIALNTIHNINKLILELQTAVDKGEAVVSTEKLLAKVKVLDDKVKYREEQALFNKEDV